MSATILVLDHPVLRDSRRSTARFELPNVPPGEYTLVGWHERVGERTRADPRRARARRRRSTCRCRSRIRSDAATRARRGAPAAPGRQDARGHLRHRRSSCSSIVFVVVSVSVREQVRQSVTANLESSQRMFAALETRRQRELLAQASTLAENPTLKAALDTYQAEARTSSEAVKAQLLATIDGELEKVAARVESDAVVLVDMRQNALAAAGRMGERWPRGRAGGARRRRRTAARSTASPAWAAPRSASSRCRCSSATATTVGTLYLATSLDAAYAEELATARRHADGDHQRRADAGEHAAARARRASSRRRSRRRGPTPARSRSTASRTRSGGSSPSATRRSTRSDRSTNRRAARCARRCATSAFTAVGRDRARAARQHHARAAAERARSASCRRRWRAMAASHDVDVAAAADRIEPRARRADRHVQRADGVGGAGRGADRGGVHGRHPRAGDRARRARSVHRRPLRSRQRAVGGDRPRARAVGRRSRGAAARRAAPRHRQDRRARRRAAEAGRADRRGIRRHQAAPGARRAHPAVGAVPRAAHPDRRAAPRAARRPRLSRTACAATTSRWPRASSTSPTPTTR